MYEIRVYKKYITWSTICFVYIQFLKSFGKLKRIKSMRFDLNYVKKVPKSHI